MHSITGRFHESGSYRRRHGSRPRTRREVHLIDEHFQASTKKALLARMLNNLRTIYLNQQAWYNGSRVLARLLALRPGSVELERELARTNANLAKLN